MRRAAREEDASGTEPSRQFTQPSTLIRRLALELPCPLAARRRARERRRAAATRQQDGGRGEDEGRREVELPPPHQPSAATCHRGGCRCAADKAGRSATCRGLAAPTKEKENLREGGPLESRGVRAQGESPESCWGYRAGGWRAGRRRRRAPALRHFSFQTRKRRESVTGAGGPVLLALVFWLQTD